MSCALVGPDGKLTVNARKWLVCHEPSSSRRKTTMMPARLFFLLLLPSLALAMVRSAGRIPPQAELFLRAAHSNGRVRLLCHTGLQGTALVRALVSGYGRGIRGCRLRRRVHSTGVSAHVLFPRHRRWHFSSGARATPSTPTAYVRTSSCTLAACVRCAFQICLPDWPWWNRHPLNWREVPDDEEDEEPKVEKKKKVKKKDKAGKESKEKKEA